MRKKSDSAGEMKALMALVNLLPKVADGRARNVRGAREKAEAEKLCVQAAEVLDGVAKSKSQVLGAGQVNPGSGAPGIKLSINGQSFEFSSAKYAFSMEGHAVALRRFLIACRETLLAVAAKTVAAHSTPTARIHPARYYPLMFENPRPGKETLTDIMPADRQTKLIPGWVSVTAALQRGFRVEADGKIWGVDPYHDGFVVVLLGCDARKIRVCEVCHDLFYARTGNQKGCGKVQHRNLASQRVHRKREKAGTYKASRKMRAAKLKAKRKVPTG